MRINNIRYQRSDLLLHKSTQILAFLGKQLGAFHADDSQTTFEYNVKKNALVGKPFKIKKREFTAAIHLSNFTLQLKSKDEVLILFLEGKRIPKVIAKVKKRLAAKKLAEFNLHYDLPEGYELEEYRLQSPEKEAVEEWGRMRHLVNLVLTDVNTLIQPPSPINIWPHHFDTGTYHVLTKDEKGAATSIGTGFAMSDTVSNTPYFYIYGWNRDQAIDFSKAPDLPVGHWETGDWKGAIVPLKEMNQMDDPQKELAAFYKAAFSFLRSQL